ncbi:MAG: PepSY domain-containing protein [Proteobacteria bacterium]|nr:PepSY domain-containing protein [Pseudomonadota bacterium]
MRPLFRRLHRYLGLALLALWLIQAATGVLMVFHWELGDATAPGPSAPADWPALERRIDALAAEHPGSRVTSVYPTGGRDGRFDLFVEGADGAGQAVLVDGAGSEIGRWRSGGGLAGTRWLEAAVTLHQTLFAGHRGRLLIGASGLLLLTNLLLGLRLAWPARGQWGRALAFLRRGPATVRLHAWHRTLGLWLALPLLVVAGAGVLLAFDDAVEDWLVGAEPAPSILAVRSPPAVGPAHAVQLALDRFPDAIFSGLTMPSDERPWYRVRLRQRGEIRRVFGTTTVLIGLGNGMVEVANDPRGASWQRRFVDACYPVHTGEAAGLGGRLLALATALGLLTSIVLGGTLWWRRRSRPAPPN